MSQTLSFSGKLNVQLTPAAAPVPLPIAFSTSFTQQVNDTLTFTDATANRAVSMGSITTPAFVMITVLSGTVAVTPSNSGANAITLSMAGTPAPTDPAFIMIYTHDPASLALYLTTLGPAVVQIQVYA